MKRVMLLAIAWLSLAAIGSAQTPTPNKADEMGTIAGIPIQRGKNWIGIELKDNTFRLTFYNEKKKPVPADASSAVFWWPVHYQPNPERTELTPTDNPAVFASSYSVRAPHTFPLHVILLFQGKPDSTETYVVDFSE